MLWVCLGPSWSAAGTNAGTSSTVFRRAVHWWSACSASCLWDNPEGAKTVSAVLQTSLNSSWCCSSTDRRENTMAVLYLRPSRVGHCHGRVSNGGTAAGSSVPASCGPAAAGEIVLNLLKMQGTLKMESTQLFFFLHISMIQAHLSSQLD